MEYVYGALLLHNAKRAITEESLSKVLEAAGVRVDEARVKVLVSALSEVDIGEAIKSATEVSAPATPSTPTPAPPATTEAKKAKKEEEEIAGLSALFG